LLPKIEKNEKNFGVQKKPAQNIVFVRAKALAYSVVIVSVVLLNWVWCFCRFLKIFHNASPFKAVR